MIIFDLIRYIRILLIRLMTFCISNNIYLNIISKVLIVAPHPDDEIMGCSGLMQSLLKTGKEVFVVILTGGEGSHCGCCSISTSDLIKARRELAVKANTASRNF